MKKTNLTFDPEHTFFTSDTHFNHANIIKLCHRPFLCFEGGYKNVWQLFGHVHTRKNNTGLDADRLQYLYPTQYDVGVDNNAFAPVSFGQVQSIINKQVEEKK